MFQLFHKNQKASKENILIAIYSFGRMLVLNIPASTPYHKSDQILRMGCV
jgi:hypothetical protein